MLGTVYLLTPGCHSQCITTEEAESRILAVASVGASREEVQTALEAAGLDFSIDEYRDRLVWSTREGCAAGTVVVVHLTFDREERLQRVEATKHRTMW